MFSVLPLVLRLFCGPASTDVPLKRFLILTLQKLVSITIQKERLFLQHTLMKDIHLRIQLVTVLLEYISETRNDTSSDTYSYTLSNGKITTKLSSYGNDIYKYDNAGYLSTITYDDDTKITLTYSSGNLTQLKSSYDNQTYTVGYSSKDSRVPFSEFHFGVFTEWGPTAMFEDALLYEQGYFGNKTKNQISSLKVGNDADTYSFTKDNQGKIISGKSDHYNLSFKYDCK